MRTITGYSLVEFLIALSLSSLIIMVLMQQYAVVKRYYFSSNKEVQLYQELIWIRSLLQRSIHNAGFTPCANIDTLISMDHQQQKPLQSFIAETDLSLSHMDESYLSATLLSNEYLQVKSTETFKEKDWLVFADCFHAERQQIRAISFDASGSILQLAHPLTFPYQKQLYVGKWIQERYFVRENKLGKRILYYHYNKNEALSENVRELQISLQNDLVSVLLRLDNGEKLLLENKIRS